MGSPYRDCRMIPGKRQTAIETVECLFYRLMIDIEAPLNVALFEEVMRRMKVWEIIGVSLRVEALLVFLTLISNTSGSRNAKTSQSGTACYPVSGSATSGSPLMRRTSEAKVGLVQTSPVRGSAIPISSMTS